jgi:TP901 family phage tail tape measure protein
VANLDIIIRAQNLASAALRQVEGQLSGIQRQASFAERGFGGLQRAVGVGMVAAAGLAVVGVGALAVGLAKSVTAAADFESQINILTVAARSSGTTMEDLSKAALQVGADSDLVGISASEAADAMTNFYKAGLTTNEIFADMQGYLAGTVPLTGALRSAIDLAAASELDLAAASDVVAIAMATFGLEAADAARIADVLVGAADASLASVGGLAEALKNVGPIAATMGISLEDTSTALAILSTRGIQGAEAGTAMRSMLLNLQRPTKAVTTALDELGVSLYSTDGTMRALPDVIGQLEGALSGLTEEQRNQYAVTLAGSYGLNAFNVLVGEGTEGWNEMSTAVANAATAQETAAARTKGFNAAIEQLKGALETLLITVGTPLIQEFLTPAAQKMGDVITQLTKMAPSVEQVRAAYDKLVASSAALLFSIQAVVGPIAEAIGRFVSWKDVLIVLGGVVASIVIPLLWGIVAAVAPVLVVFAALVGAVALIRTAWERDWGGIQEKTATVLAALATEWDSLKAWLETTLPAAITFLSAAWNTAWTAIQAAFDTAKATIQTGVDAVKAWLDTELPSALTTLQTAWSTAWTAVQAAFDTAKAAIETGIETVKGWFATDVPGALGTLETKWAAVTSAIQTAWKMVVDFLQPTIDKIIAAFPLMIASFEPIGGKLKELWEVAGPVILKLNAVLGIGLVAAVKLFGETIAVIMPHVGAVVGMVIDALILAFTAIDTALTATLAYFQTNWPAIQAAIETAWANIKVAFDAIVLWFTVTIPMALDALLVDWETIWNSIKAKTISIVGVITGVLNQIAVFASVTVPNAITAFKTFLGGLTLPNPFIAINTAISGIQSAIDGAKSAINSFKSWLGSISIPNPFSGFSLPNVGGLLGGNASGTGFFGGGLTLVGERGPEIVMLPRGSRIESSERTSQMMGNGGMTVNVYATVSNQMDVEELAYRVAQTIQRRQR